MIQIKIPDKQLSAVTSMLALVPKRMNYGIKQMLNVLADEVTKSELDMLKSHVDRPTPFTLGAIRTKYAGENDLTALVWVKDADPKNKTMGQKSHYLLPLVSGGARPRKGFESYLVHGGQQFYAQASNDYPLDQYGNLPRGKIIQVLSQLKLFKENGFKANRTGASTMFPVWQLGERGGLLPGIYERFAMSKAGKIKSGKSAFKRRKGKPALYPRGIRPLMMLSTRQYQYQKQLPWYEVGKSTINAKADKAAAVAIKYALGTP